MEQAEAGAVAAGHRHGQLREAAGAAPAGQAPATSGRAVNALLHQDDAEVHFVLRDEIGNTTTTQGSVQGVNRVDGVGIVHVTSTPARTSKR